MSNDNYFLGAVYKPRHSVDESTAHVTSSTHRFVYTSARIIMFRLVLPVILFVVAHGQYGGGYSSQNQITEPPYQRNYHPPAPVHYVNIGANLAGDYKFGYDTGKGPLGQSFREETRLPDGTVKGAYGIQDANGRQRIIRYTAGKAGFMAEGDVGPEGAPKATFPGPAPQAPAPQYTPQPQYNPPPQQYNPPAQHYSPPAQHYSPPAQQYRPAPQQQYRTDGQYDSKWDKDYYDNSPPFIDVERLSYNIGASG